MIITFIGNCQCISLCFYFQLLVYNKIHTSSWVLYGEEFREHIGSWSNKCKNKILDYNKSIEQIKISDVIVYQEIVKEKSFFSNTETLLSIMKQGCKLIRIPSIYLDYNDYDNSLQELKRRENAKSVDITVSTIFEKYRNKNILLMLNIWHPTTFLFLEIMKELCLLMNIEFFRKRQYIFLLKNNNFMGLPT
jgi:hypothetical protein